MIISPRISDSDDMILTGSVPMSVPFFEMKTVRTVVLPTVLTLSAGLGMAEAQSLRVGVATHPSTLDPQKETGNDAAQFLYNIFDTLIERVPDASPLQFKPGLALSWRRVSPTVWELNLRDGVKMHDGSTLTAEDVQFSLDRVFKKTDPRFASAQGRFFYNFSHVEVVAPLVVRIHTRQPEPLFEVLISARNAGITSRRHVERLGLDKSMLAPIGTGPYKLVKLTPGREAVIERHDSFWGEPAPFKTITYQRIPEVASRVTALVNGEVDFITSIPPDQERLIPGSRFAVKGVVWPMFHVMVVKMTEGPTKDVRIRQAMNLSVDREKLTRALWSGKGKSPTAHQFPDYGAPLYIEGLKTIAYDPKRAAQLVKEAGYDGTPIKITYQPGYYLHFDLAAQAVQQMWQAIGLKVVIEQTERYDYAKTVVRPWSNPMYYPDPMGAFDTHWSQASWTAVRGFFKPAHPEWNSLYKQARFSLEPEVRREAYRKLIEIGEQEGGWILLYQPYESFAMRADIQWTVPKALRPYSLNFRAGQIRAAGKQ
jgi:peptide/nickel transport system substrate-binding protein